MVGKGLLKIFLMIANVLFVILGGIALGIGIWMAIDKIFISDIIGTTLFSAASYMMILCGVILLVIAFVGCWGTMMESKKVLLAYIVISVVAVVLLILSGILAAAFKGQLQSSMTAAMESSLKNQYGYMTESNAENKRITDSWDLTQKLLRCCAVDDNGFGLYRYSLWYKTYEEPKIEKDGKKYVPESCCKYIDRLKRYENLKHCQSNQWGPPGHLDYTAALNDALYYTGCYQAAKTFVEDNSAILVAIGFCFGFLLVAGIVLALLLYRRIAGKFIPVRTQEETVHMG